MILRNFILIFLQTIIFVPLFGQNNNDTIHIINGSFEGKPGCCKPPPRWVDCGSPRETPTDIHPVLPPLEPLFGVTMKAYDGNTYLGMVVRENKTYERNSQKLTKPLESGKCYNFSIYMNRSMEYQSHTNSYNYQLKSFTTPVLLKIWGGVAYCHQLELLGTSPPVENTEWQRFDFEFMPQSNITHFELEAYYSPSSQEPYNGNLLLDHASDIILVPCKTSKNK